jgi:putative endopeptidase
MRGTLLRQRRIEKGPPIRVSQLALIERPLREPSNLARSGEPMSQPTRPLRDHRLFAVVGAVVLTTSSVGFASACSGTQPTTPGPKDPPTSSAAPSESVAVTPPAPKKPPENSSLDKQGLSSAALDKTADPCEDFYQFACGGWIKATEIPNDKARWTRSFSEIDKRNEADEKAIVEAAVAKKGEKTDEGKLGQFYASCMDEKAIDKAGLKPVQAFIDASKKVTDAKSLEKVLANLHQRGITPFFEIEKQQNDKDATQMIARVDQSGLGLPDRDYYLSTDDKKVKIRKAYTDHVAAMLKLAGYKEKDATAAADDILKFETDIAKAQKSREERRDPQTMYNKGDRDGLKKAAPGFDWDAYFKDIGFPDLKDINITSPAYITALDGIIKAAKPETLQNYLVWTILHQGSFLLSKPFEDEAFKLTNALTGQKTQRDRWKRCIDATDGWLGDLLAKPFVALRFGGDAKKAAEDYVKAIAAAFDARVGELDWMDDATKAKARDKLKAMAYLIGYPPRWKNYDFPVTAIYGDNVLAGAAWQFKDELSKVGKPVDREEWQMTAPTVNAYYDGQHNHMVFPAGILQPPFYDPKASVPVNLGAMGMVVGHELTHGFDDEGSQYNKEGNLENWWSPSVLKTFNEKGKCVEDQYSAYEPIPGVKLNGKLTEGENIADVGGMKLAFRAYRSLRASAPTEVIADGYTEDQQFFISTGQIWCSKYTDEETTRLASIDPHSHPRFRVNGPMSQLPEFADAFQCKVGSKMVAKKKCSIW